VNTEAMYFVVGLIFSALFVWNIVLTIKLNNAQISLHRLTTTLIGVSLGKVKLNVDESSRIVTVEEK